MILEPNVRGIASRNLQKRKRRCFIVCVFCLHCLLLHFFIYLYIAFFILMLLVYYCLLVYDVNKFFVFVAFIYHFNVQRCNKISIFATISVMVNKACGILGYMKRLQ